MQVGAELRKGGLWAEPSRSQPPGNEISPAAAIEAAMTARLLNTDNAQTLFRPAAPGS